MTDIEYECLMSIMDAAFDFGHPMPRTSAIKWRIADAITYLEDVTGTMILAIY